MILHFYRCLFHKAILQSGCALSCWAYVDRETTIRRAFKLGELLGCKTDNVEELAKFFREQPHESLTSNEYKVLLPEETRQLTFPFVPCQEVRCTSNNNFLVEDPEELIKAKKYFKIPHIIGGVDVEGMILFKEDPQFLSHLNLLTSDASYLLPPELSKTSDEKLVDKVKQFYLKRLPLTICNYLQYIDLWGDISFYVPINKVIKYLTSDPCVPVYLYYFTFDGKLAFLKNILQPVAATKLPKGVCHADELGYLFHIPHFGDEWLVDKDSIEMDFLDKFVTFWTNFAKSGNPSDDKYSVKWEMCQPSKLCHIEINEPLKLVPGIILPCKSEFWQDMYDSVKSSCK